MPSHDAEALAELARLCSEVRTHLPETGYQRLRVLLDMILLDLAHEGFSSEARTEAACETKPTLPQKSP